MRGCEFGEAGEEARGDGLLQKGKAAMGNDKLARMMPAVKTKTKTKRKENNQNRRKKNKTEASRNSNNNGKSSIQVRNLPLSFQASDEVTSAASPSSSGSTPRGSASILAEAEGVCCAGRSLAARLSQAKVVAMQSKHFERIKSGVGYI
jgi:hypothetical protein